MIFIKAWRESRMRFWCGLALILLWCLFTVILAKRGMAANQLPSSFSRAIWAGFYSNLGPMFYLTIASLLGLGGLRRERSVGTLPFTLALPFSRDFHLFSRVVVGLAQLSILAVLPSLALPSFARIFASESYAISHAAAFIPAFLAWGCLSFALSALISTLVDGELSGIAIVLLVVAVYRIAAETIFDSYPAAHPVKVMSGLAGGSLDVLNGSLKSTIPDTQLAVLVGASIMLITVAAALNRRVQV